MWVRWMASPKQPQSISGLNITSASVSRVKKHMKAVAAIAVAFLHTPVTRAAPIAVSAKASAVPIGFESTPRKLMCMKLRYSSITSPAPTGSISFSTPETKNENPVMNAQKRLMRCVKYFISVIFLSAHRAVLPCRFPLPCQPLF